MNRYYTKSVFEKIRDFIGELFSWLIRVLEAPFAYFVLISAIVITSFIMVVYQFGGVRGLSFVLNVVVSAPPVIQVYLISILGLFVVLSLLPRIFPGLESVFFGGDDPHGFIHIVKYTGVPFVLLVALVWMVISSWDPHVPWRGTWSNPAIGSTIGFSMMFFILALCDRLFKDIIYSFVGNELVVKTIYGFLLASLLVFSMVSFLIFPNTTASSSY
ncbi:MAG TPA: hypothetical protein PKY31_17860 [Spirochaetota bacterium]|nr:hypothetical protein [Spirochaetota bacterium]